MKDGWICEQNLVKAVFYTPICLLFIIINYIDYNKSI